MNVNSVTLTNTNYNNKFNNKKVNKKNDISFKQLRYIDEYAVSRLSASALEELKRLVDLKNIDLKIMQTSGMNIPCPKCLIKTLVDSSMEVENICRKGSKHQTKGKIDSWTEVQFWSYDTTPPTFFDDRSNKYTFLHANSIPDRRFNCVSHGYDNDLMRTLHFLKSLDSNLGKGENTLSEIKKMANQNNPTSNLTSNDLILELAKLLSK